MVLHTAIRWLSRLIICLCLCFYPASIYCFKINSPKVLLAYKNLGLSSNYTLEVTGSGCYKWHSANPQIVHVTPVFSESCSKKAIVSSVANLLERKVTEVSVTEDGITVYCDVITDAIASIKIDWVDDELVLGSPPQKLTVVAMDKKGHTFDSINGIEVKWNVIHLKENELASQTENSEVIRISRFAGSKYEHPEKENEFEKRGFLSTSVLVEPLQLGSAFINATLLSSYVASKKVLTTQNVKLNVVSGLKLYPTSPLYLLHDASVNVKLKKIKNEDVNLDDFTVEVDSPEIINLAEDLSHLHAKKYGLTSILYKDKNKFESSLLNVHIVKLHHINFRISGGDYNILEEMKIYECVLDLYDEDGNLIHASDNLRFSVNFPTKLFHVILTTANGTYSVVQTIAPGHGKIRAEFKGAALENGTISKEYAISGALDVHVYQKLSISPPFQLLHVLPEKPMHRVPLTVAGGTGEYVWALNNYEVATVITDKENNRGVYLEIYAEIYNLTVFVTDRNNVNFIATAQVSVQTPLDIEAYPTVTEAEVGNSLYIPTALLGYENKERQVIRKFDDCSKADIKVDIIEKHILAFEKEADIPAFGKGCISLQFRCKMAGHSRVNMFYNITREDDRNNITYKTTVVLACYKPLKPVHPVRVGLLALGTSMEVAFEGGPRKWPLYKEGYYSELQPSNAYIVEIQLIKDPVRYNKDLTVFRVTCKGLGENILTLRIGNQPSATMKHPAKSEASIKLICAEPSSLHLKLFKEKSRRKKLKDENIVKVPFYGEKTFAVDIFVKDSMGRRFANISSLRVVWDVSDRSLAIPVNDFDFVTYENAVSGYRKLSRNFNEFKLKGRSSTDDLKVDAKITSYKKEVLFKEGIEEYKEIEEITTSLDLKLVSLRDINDGLYDAVEENQNEDGYCENNSCKS